MFFLAVIIFIIQLLVLGIIVSYLINLDMKILFLIELVQDMNSWVSSRSKNVEIIFDDIKGIIKNYRDKLLKRHRSMVLKQVIAILEWLLFIFLKKRGKRILLGYKLAKTIAKELSTLKNMV